MKVLDVQDVSIRYILGDFKEIGLKEYVMRKLTHNYHVREFCPPGYKEEYLLQICADGTASRLDKRKPEWITIEYRDNLLEEEDILLARQDAERLED